jgi:hypothetical protein
MIPYFDRLQFMVRRQVLQMYKDLVKTVNQIGDASYRVELTEWLRRDFKQNKNLTDTV